jgi:hypothetical protein
MFIRVSAYIYINICVCTVFLKKDPIDHGQPTKRSMESASAPGGGDAVAAPATSKAPGPASAACGYLSRSISSGRHGQ